MATRSGSYMFQCPLCFMERVQPSHAPTTSTQDPFSEVMKEDASHSLSTLAASGLEQQQQGKERAKRDFISGGGGVKLSVDCIHVSDSDESTSSGASGSGACALAVQRDRSPRHSVDARVVNDGSSSSSRAAVIDLVSDADEDDGCDAGRQGGRC